MECRLCPRNCGADRASGQLGFCGIDNIPRIARYAPHLWEEPCLSGQRGAGTIFFSGCSLGCVYCQNRDISRGQTGERADENRLGKMIFELEEQGVHCIEFVTPTHHTDTVARVLERIKPSLKIPTVWNSGGYEKPETLRMLDGLIDIYLPDFKYGTKETAEKYSAAGDYTEYASAAVREMFRQTGNAEFYENGMMKKGVIVRHLVLPGNRHDSVRVLEILAEILPVKDIRLSLMSQYTPDFANDTPYAELQRRVTSFEYKYVLKVAESLGFLGYFQERASADKKYTPEF